MSSSLEKDNNGCMDYRLFLESLFVLKGQIFGNLILDLLSSHFTAYFSDTLLLVLLGVVIWRRHQIRYLLIQRVGEKNYQFYQLVTVLVSVVCYFVAQFSLALLFQMMNGQAFTKRC